MARAVREWKAGVRRDLGGDLTRAQETILEQHGRGEPGRAGEKVRVGVLLDALVVNYEVNARPSLDTLKSRVKVLRAAFATSGPARGRVGDGGFLHSGCTAASA